MKIIFLILTILIALNTAFSQGPDSFSYSTEIRVNKELVKAKKINFKISLLQDSIRGRLVYSAIQSIKTDNYGVVNIVIGASDTTLLSSIDWGNNVYFIKLEADINLNGDYENSITSQILSVPYAFHSNSADKITGEINEKDPYYVNSIASGISTMDTNSWNDIVRKHKHFIGELYGGGIVYWITSDGMHGLIASKSDLIGGKKAKWDPRPDPQRSRIGARSFYDGKSNTAAILADFHDSGYPATECSKYVCDGYNDWYLPSNQELQLMMGAAYIINKELSEDHDPNSNGLTMVGEFNEWGRYWSSTEALVNAAYYAYFSLNKMEFAKKDTPARVRAIRLF